jgi:hypothetical protein
MVPTGDLIVRNVDSADAAHAFQCRTVHRLTGETTVSAPARIIISTGRKKRDHTEKKAQFIPYPLGGLDCGYEEYHFFLFVNFVTICNHMSLLSIVVHSWLSWNHANPSLRCYSQIHSRVHQSLIDGINTSISTTS